MIAPLIGLAFGLLWFLGGAGAVARPVGPLLMVAGILIFALAAFRVMRRGRTTGGGFDRRYYLAAVAAEIVAIMVAQKWLTSHAHADLLFPVVGVIVGLHFVGLWKGFGLKRFLALAAAMVVINLVALLPHLTAPQRMMISGFGSSAALLLSAAA